MRHHRRSIRLRGWDYAHPGWYYVTIVVKDRECHFGRVINGAMEHSPLGIIADEYWRQIPQHHVGVGLDEHIVMPNHVHGIVIINEKQRTDEDVHGGDVFGRDVQSNVPTGDTEAMNVPTGDADVMNILSGNTDAINAPTDYPNALNAPRACENDKGRTTNKPMSPAKGSLSVIIRTFKADVTTWAHNNGYGGFAWLGRFHDHIIRDEVELRRIRDYIRNNPREWARDHENPANDPMKAK